MSQTSQAPTSGETPSGAPATYVVDDELKPPSANTGLLEVFRRRYLLKLLVQREISARYQGSFLGFMWSYVNPLSQFFIYWFVMGRLMGSSHRVEAYAVHVFAALVVVHFFNETFGAGTRSIMRNKALIKKMAMPREMFPVAAMLVSLYHVVPQLIILVIVSLLYGWTPDMGGMVAAVLGIAIIAVLGTALALLFSVANVFFSDFGSAVGIMTNYVRFGVPMMYSYEMVHHALPKWGVEVYLANPIADAVLLIERAFWVGTTKNPAHTVATALPDHLMWRGLITLGFSLVILAIAQLVFAKLDRKIPERV